MEPSAPTGAAAAPDTVPHDHATANDAYDPAELGTRTRLVAAAYVVLRRGSQVLLQLRQGTGYMDGHWAVLAGHLEPDESVLDGASREALEEAGVVLAAADLRPLTTFHRFQPGGPAIEQRVDFFFEADRWTGEPTVLEPDKCAEMRWWDLASLPEPVVPHELVVLQHLAAGTAPPAVLTVES
jgi:ADP-ribose pyrophosphatase YjhB (NUDIX family)